MNKINKKLILVIIISVTVLFAGWKLSGSLTTSNTAPPKIVSPVVAEVLITKTGFSPSTIKVKAGTEVIWRVKDTTSHQIESNPHPVHSELPELNESSKIGPSDTYAYTFNKAGTYNYHDETDPTRNGTVVVE